ncbi:pyridoxal-phosphate dependent enzyme [Haliangium ochraceum]|uniref:Pyridoxal-5'-phosphate-dependent protein beta subunit n=1 Tax=Haliangium ochraceum (strain DSM 14365 / JCM 11303 / SMP-2) TaxID=502025 RepID=D0LV75_HALO1|nr:pyridoxal-phosphate dependent enzyme [Haliangium ochraceum]ACY15916.1 Pyridoxal-5'-phosphate-dependent protein beta subunit [Haliangium ochraceum DSM 14365]
MPEPALTSFLQCAGCGLRADADAPLPFACAGARAGDDIDHVMTPRLALAGCALGGADERPLSRDRGLQHSYRLGRRLGLSDGAYLDLAAALDERVAAVWGHGFTPARYRRADALAGALGLGSGPGSGSGAEPGGEGSARLWIADDSGGVAGSHKARHLAGLALHLEVLERLGLTPGGDAGSGAGGRALAIASCGNAALAAAVVARAAERPLRVFVPTWADGAIVERLSELGAHIERCARAPDGPPGDPCYHRFRAAVAAGALPFSCQGPDNGLTHQGAHTLGWDIVRQHTAAGGPALTRVLVQVGGGALASAVAGAMDIAAELGAVARAPALHAVQSRGCYPLRGAWRKLAEGVLGRAAARLGDGGANAGAEALDDAALAAAIAAHAHEGELAAELAAARRARSAYMQPWAEEPRSVATGILDDETYDWAAVCAAMLRTGGWPVVVGDADILAAQAALAEHEDVRAEPTGAVALAGAAALARAGQCTPEEHIAALVTGAADKGLPA